MRVLGTTFLLLCFASLLPAAKPLEIYFIDVEGGQSTLLVAPSGESMLVDTGWSAHNGRDAARIAAAAKAAGVKRIDYLVITHYHEDHVGGVAQLMDKLPVRNFVDHGPSVESGRRPDELMRAYLSFAKKGNRITVKPGDSIPIKGLDVKVLASAGAVISQPVEGAGAANPLCANFKPREEDKSENARSLGTLITLGKFRMIDLGDLTWNREHDLACPDNKVGTVDLYLVTHHGMDISGPPCLVHALQPRVAIMNNGARKGGTPAAFQTIRSSPGLEDIWQLHYAVAGGKENNPPDMFIANTDENCEGKWIRVTAHPDGSFTVVNTRNKSTKTYAAR